MFKISRLKVFLIIFSCLVAFFIITPNFLSSEKQDFWKRYFYISPVQLGLDLKGGAYLLIEVDKEKYMKDKLSFLQNQIRTVLRKAKIRYLHLRQSDSSIQFTLKEIQNYDEMSKLLNKALPGVNIEKQDALVTIGFSEQNLNDMNKSVVEQSIEIVRRRVDEAGTKETIIQRQGDDRILLQVPGLTSPEQLKRLLGKTAILSFHLMADDNNNEMIHNPNVLVVQGENAMENGQIPQYHIIAQSIMTGNMLVNAGVAFNKYGDPAVSFVLNNEGTHAFAQVTKNNIGKPLVIVLDGKVISAPLINEPIVGGSGIINGHFTTESANELAMLLRAGALPAPLTIIEERSVGPSLGADSIEAGAKACIVGVLLIIIFMVWTYGIMGLFANIALIINIVLLIDLLQIFQATLTMPGIAGIVLAMGMAVDANVLIFERIREESHQGMSLLPSVERGFTQAMSAIIDSNLTTVIVAILLYMFGTGPVRGFAVTLTLGIISSLYSAIIMTRYMIAYWLKIKRPKSILL